LADHPGYPVELITPEGVAYAGDAEVLVVPGAAGELGILANHAPLISLLKPGETRITDESGTVKRYATDDGYVQVRANRAIVLVGEALDAESIDGPDAARRLEEAREALERAEGGDGDVYAARRAAAFAEAVAKVARG
jgi:F-type H+-transporting ATPase subunit epsilon